MRAALLLVDVQRDFLARPGLCPDPQTLLHGLKALLDGCREAGIPVLHAHTRVCADGTDRMPHWERAGYRACVEGTAGAAPPDGLAPSSDEPVFYKRYFSAFGSEGLATTLAARRVDTLIVAGLYTHGCVRATVLDAYERGLEVLVAHDAVASTEPVHAEITRSWLDGRAARFLGSAHILRRLTGTAAAPYAGAERMPVACVGDAWRDDATEREHRHFDPARRARLAAVVPLAGPDVVADAVRAAVRSQRAWASVEPAVRFAFLDRWGEALRREEEPLARLLAAEIGKPLGDAREETRRALAHVAAARRAPMETAIGVSVRVRQRPVGCVGLVTPWNNPIAIPAAKIAAALAYGNAVVWKPAPQAPQAAIRLMRSLLDAGLPAGVLSLVFGDGETARHLVTEPGIAAVSVTGSIPTGRTVAALCALSTRPLQAELGGNNAVIVLRDADVEAEADALARAAFSFAGQRCTAIRRFIVERSHMDEFLERFVAATRALRLGDPLDERTEVGPLLSPERVAAVEAVVHEAVASGAELLTGGGAPAGLGDGCWLEPAVLSAVRPDSAVALEETFGPVAVVLPADDLDDAIALANAVPHGLVAGLLTRDRAARARFAESVEAGILKLARGPFSVHPDAPFGGWKASGIGPPEHGRWDAEFYSRPQAIYGEVEAP